MFHVAAYTASLGSVTNSDVPALADSVLAIANNHFLPQTNLKLFWAWVAGGTLDRGRIVSPTNRMITLPFVRPINGAILPANDPNVADYRLNPFQLEALEELSAELSTNAAGPSRSHLIIGVGTGLDPMPAGNVFTLRATSTTAATANVWTQLAVTFADTLPAGNYAIVGLEVFSTNAFAARLILEGVPWRPGGISINALGNRTHDMFRKGGLGRWGTFRSTRMPIVEVLANAADASHEIYLDIIRVPGGPVGSI